MKNKLIPKEIGRIYPNEWNDAINACYEAMITTTKSISNTFDILTKCDNTLKETGYPVDNKMPSYKQWGINAMIQHLKTYRSRLRNVACNHVSK